MTLPAHTTYEPAIVTSADGTRICADAVGNREAGCPTIVLIHGFSVVKEAFDPIFEDSKWISNTFLVRYDTRGHGKSEKPLADSAWASERMAEDFEAVCKKFQVKSAIVLGWSLGAAFFSDLVNFASSVDIAGFINVAGPPYIDQDVFARVATPATLGILVALSQPPSVDVFQENALNLVHLFSEVISHDLFCTLLEGVIIQPRAVTAQVVSRKQDPTKLLQEGRDGKMEVLVVTGGKDSLVSAPGLRTVYEEMGWKKCTVKHLDEADHMPWVSRGDEFREIVLGWIKGGGM